MNCGAIGKEALGHDWGTWAVTVNPSCVSEGVETRTCRRPGCTQVETRSIPRLEHDFSGPTCTSPSVCSTCNVSGVPALGHNYGSWKTLSEGSCTEPGTLIRYCQNAGCNASETKSTTALGHSLSGYWEDVSTAGICEKYIIYCSRCSYSYTYMYDYSHNFTNDQDTVCNDCGYRCNHNFENK